MSWRQRGYHLREWVLQEVDGPRMRKCPLEPLVFKVEGAKIEVWVVVMLFVVVDKNH